MHSSFRRLSSQVFCISAIVLLGLTPLHSQDAAKATEPGSFRAGARTFSFPSPSSNLVEAGADYRVLLEPLAPTTNRLVAAFVRPDDLSILRTGKGTRAIEYALVEVPRQAEFADITPEIFTQIADSVATAFGTKLDQSVKDSEEEVNRHLKALSGSAAVVSIDKPVYLGTLFSKTDAHGFGSTMAYSSNGATVTMAMAIVVFRVQNRVFFGYLYKRYEDESTLLWLRKASEQWADSILAANKQ